MAWGSLATNQFVSFTDAQGSGFTQLHTLPTSDQFMDKVDALYYLNLDSSYMSGITDDQFPEKSLFVAGAAAPTVNNTYYTIAEGNCYNEIRILNGYTTFAGGFASYKLYRDASLIHTQSTKPYNGSYDFYYVDAAATVGTNHAYIVRLTDSLGQYTDTTTKYGTAIECNLPTISSALGISRRLSGGYIEVGVGYNDDETTVYRATVHLIGYTEGMTITDADLACPTPLSQNRYDTWQWYASGMTAGRTYRIDVTVDDSNNNRSTLYSTADFVW